MKKVFLIPAIFALALLVSCKKEKKDENNNTNTNNPPSGYTPPTTNYWKISGESANSSADAFQVNIAATNAGISKPFPSYGYCQLNISRNDGYSNDSIYREIRSKVSEGGYKEISVSKTKSLGYTPNGDSLSINLVLVEGGSYYYFVSQGGSIYVSKKNNKLRFSTKGAINMIGAKNGALNDYLYSKTVDFSWEEN